MPLNAAISLRSAVPCRLIEWHELDRIHHDRGQPPGAARLRHPGRLSAPDEQTSGHGRHGRALALRSRTPGLYVSIVLRYRFAPNDLPVVTLALGLAAVEAIQKSTDLACDLRWPNDVLIRLQEMRGNPGAASEGSAIIAGIGINVNHSAFPSELDSIATSLRIARAAGFTRARSLLVELIYSR